jgi:phosphoribosyl-ATP pyrophosphohydrolase
MKTFEELHTELVTKWAEKDPTSGTVTRLLEDGVHGVGKKVVKERAAVEISQLIFFTQVLMLAADVSLEDVYRHL